MLTVGRALVPHVFEASFDRQNSEGNPEGDISEGCFLAP